jgi:GrpB-like predicted nucleotidyltransferase (UPF0157 family)
MSDIFELHPPPPELEQERERIDALVRTVVPHADVLEVGSTAVDGVIGKQDLDLLVRVAHENFARTRALLDAHFPRDARQLSNELYQGYRIASPMDAALQLTVRGCEYDRFTLFLDALREDPALVASYNELKRRWHGRSMAGYREEKAAFIESALAACSQPRLR